MGEPSAAVVLGSGDTVVTCQFTRGMPPHEIRVARDFTAPAPIEAGDDSPYSFEYTGRHDHGPLLPIPAESRYNYIIDAIIEAKKAADAHFRTLVPATASAGASAGGEGSGKARTRPAGKAKGQPQRKKPRVATEEEDEGEEAAAADEGEAGDGMQDDCE